MPSRMSLTLLICMIGAAIAVAALFLSPREAATPAPTEPSVQVTAGPAQISIEAFTFSEVPSIAPGDEVLIINNDSVPHTLTADDGSFDTGLLQPGEQAVVTAPAQPGDYSFFCEVHPSMTGALVVAAS